MAGEGNRSGSVSRPVSPGGESLSVLLGTMPTFVGTSYLTPGEVSTEGPPRTPFPLVLRAVLLKDIHSFPNSRPDDQVIKGSVGSSDSFFNVLMSFLHILCPQ